MTTSVSAVPAWERAIVLLTGTVVGVVLVAALYWARVVFIPVALAIFLTFLSTPLVKAIQRRGLGRIPSVITAALITVLVVGGLGWFVAQQATRLLNDLPTYATNIKDKVKTLKNLGSDGGVARLETMIERVIDELETEAVHERDAVAAGPKGKPTEHAASPPATMFVSQGSASWLTSIAAYVNSAMDGAVCLALAIVLVIFMLLTREDLRNRFISLVGRGRISSTTKALDEAGHRISRYLLMQAVVNGSYGLVLALGLYALRVDYAFLWGTLAAVLRYVPYLGPWIAALFPISLSLAMSEGWWQPLLVIGLVLILELISNNVVEPWLYGRSIGVSQVALLIVAAFWAFLWGPIGLVLSAPLTVCLVVLGKYVPQLAFLDVLLGDQPALDADVAYYQRLLARDQDDAEHLVLEQVKLAGPEEVYDELLLPALSYARRDRLLDALTEADERFVQQATSEILDDLGERQTNVAPTNTLTILGAPARDESDRLGLEMLRQLLDTASCTMEVTAVESQSELLAARVAAESVPVVCIGSLPPGGLARTRYLCKRLRARSPQVKILVGRWGLGDDDPLNAEQLLAVGADAVTTSLVQSRDQLQAWLRTPAAIANANQPVASGESGQSGERRETPEPVLA